MEICRRLDAIPLAIELAAARVISMSPAEIAGLLDERFRLLTGGRRRGVERHQTLRATVEWSYSLLDEHERTIFDRLGVFVGSFDADAATAVAGDDGLAAWDVRDALDDLAAKSMIVLDDGPDAAARVTGSSRPFVSMRSSVSTTPVTSRSIATVTPSTTRASPRRPGAAGGTRRGGVVPAFRRRARQPPRRGRLGPRRPSTSRCRAGSANRRPARRPGLLSPVGRRGRVGRDRPGTRQKPRPPAGAVQCLPPRPGKRSSKATTTSHAACVRGVPRRAPCRHALTRMGASHVGECRLLCRGPHASAANARGRPASARRHRCARLRPPRTGPQRPHGPLGGRSTRGGPRARRGGPPAGPCARQPEPAHRCAPVVRRDASIGRVGRNDPGTRRMPGLQPRRRHSRRTRRAATSRVARPAPCSSPRRAPAIEALHEGVVRAHDTGQSVMLAFVLSCGVSVAANLDAPELAAMLGGAVTDGPLAGLTYLVDPRDAAHRQGLLDHARAQLGPDRYDAAYRDRRRHVRSGADRVHPRRPRPTFRRGRRWLSCPRGR